MKRILIVEDSPLIRNVTAKAVSDAGYEAITAVDGMEGLNKAKESVPDLILLDVMMPKMDGYQVCRMLKFDPNYKHIPIIMLTGRDQEQDKEIGASVGVDRFCVKASNLTELFANIKELLGE